MGGIVVAVLILGTIIVIHELGHFLVAKFFGIKVETFSIGFGPRIVGFRRGDTDYRISAFPLGGYVKMAGESPTEATTGDPCEFTSKPKYQRFLVAAAGPIMNIVLAIVLLTGLFMHGVRVPEFTTGEPIVGIVEPDSPAARADIHPGDKILAIDGEEMPSWEQIGTSFLTNPGLELSIVVERLGQRIETAITPERRGPNDAGYAGVGPKIRTDNVVQSVVDGSPAQAGGIRSGDEVVRVKDIDIKTSGKTVQDVLQNTQDEAFSMVVLRDGREVPVQVSPTVRDGRKTIGVYFRLPDVLIKLGLGDALGRSIQANRQYAFSIFQVLRKLFRGEASLKQLDGPIGIVRISGQAMGQGLSTMIMLMAIISLNLGVMNALPIPVFDGGVMLFLIVEAVMGRDLSLNAKERIAQVSFVLLLGLTAVVLYNDIMKWASQLTT